MIGLLKQSMKIVGASALQIGKDYASEPLALVNDANEIRQDVFKTGKSGVDELKRIKNSVSFRGIREWFFQKQNDFEEYDEDDFDAGFDFDSDEDEKTSNLLDSSSMKNITNAQTGELYKIGAKQAEVSMISSAEIISAVNSRSAELVSSINNMNTTLIGISKRLDQFTNIYLNNQQRDYQQNVVNPFDNGRLSLASIYGASKQNASNSLAITLGSTLKTAITSMKPKDLLAAALSMTILNRPIDRFDGNSINDIGEKFNEFIGNGIQRGLGELISSDKFIKLFGDLRSTDRNPNYGKMVENPYNGKPAVFDGYVRTSITTTIPEYLKLIYKSLSGQSVDVDTKGMLTTKDVSKEVWDKQLQVGFRSTGTSTQVSSNIGRNIRRIHDRNIKDRDIRDIQKLLVNYYAFHLKNECYPAKNSLIVSELQKGNDHIVTKVAEVLSKANPNKDIDWVSVVHDVLTEIAFSDSNQQFCETVTSTIATQERNAMALVKSGNPLARHASKFTPEMMEEQASTYITNSYKTRELSEEIYALNREIREYEKNKKDIKSRVSDIRSGRASDIKEKRKLLDEKTKEYYELMGYGNPSQSSYGNYLNMSERGCGPIALSDMIARRTGMSMDPKLLAKQMQITGTYSPINGTSVGDFVDVSNSMGIDVYPGQVSMSSLRQSSRNNPITLIGSGVEFGTRQGNNHFVNAIGSDGFGGVYIQNPLTGRTERRSINDVASSSILGLYGSGNQNDMYNNIRDSAINATRAGINYSKNKVNQIQDASSNWFDNRIQRAYDKTKDYVENSKRLSEEDKQQAMLVYSMMETGVADGDPAPDKAAIMNEISKIKNQQLKSRLKSAVSGMLERSEKKAQSGGLFSKIFGNLKSGVKGVIGTFFAPIVGAIKGIGSKIIAGIKLIFKPLFKLMKSGVRSTWSGTKEIGRSIFGNKELRDENGNIIEGGYDGLLKNSFRYIKNTVKIVGKATSAVIKGMTTITGFIKTGVSKITNFISKGVGTLFSKVTTFGKNMFGKLFNRDKDNDVDNNSERETSGLSKIFQNSQFIQGFKEARNRSAYEINAKKIESAADAESQTITSILSGKTQSVLTTISDAISKIVTNTEPTSEDEGVSLGNDDSSSNVETSSSENNQEGENSEEQSQPKRSLIGRAVDRIRGRNNATAVSEAVGEEGRTSVSKGLGKMLGGITSALGGITKFLIGIVASMSAVKVISSYVQKIFTSALQPLNDLLSSTFDAIRPVLDQMGGMLKDFIGVITDAIKPLIPSITSIMSSLLEIAKPIIETLTPVIEIIGDVLSGILPMIAKILKKVVVPVIKGISKVISGILKAVRSVFNFFKKKDKKDGEKRDSIWKKIWKITTSVILPAYGRIKTIAKHVESITGGIKVIGGLLGVIGGSITTLGGLIVSGIGSLVGLLGKIPVIGGAFGEVAKDISSTGNKMMDVGANMVTGSVNLMKEGINQVREDWGLSPIGVQATKENPFEKVVSSISNDNNSNVTNVTNNTTNNTTVVPNTSKEYLDKVDIVAAGNVPTTQHSYGNYLNMSERGCGPIALADAMSRRTGRKISASNLASNMANRGLYDPSRGTSVDSFIKSSNAMGVSIKPGGVSYNSLKRATPDNPITLVGSGTEFGTRKGNNHFINVVSTDKFGGAYVINPITGKVERRSSNSLAASSTLGLYASGDVSSEDTSYDSLGATTSSLIKQLASLASNFLKPFQLSDDVDNAIEEVDKKETESAEVKNIKNKASVYGDENLYGKIENRANELLQKDFPKQPEETEERYQTRLKYLQSTKLNEYIIKATNTDEFKEFRDKAAESYNKLTNIGDSASNLFEGDNDIRKVGQELTKKIGEIDYSSSGSTTNDQSGVGGTFTSDDGVALYNFGESEFTGVDMTDCVNASTHRSKHSPLHEFFGKTQNEGYNGYAYSEDGNFYFSRRYPDKTGKGTSPDSSIHGGIDFNWSDGSAGKQVHSTCDGTVIRAELNPSCGNMVEIKDSAGYIHWYMHMRDLPLVTVGQNVKGGDLIGYVGNTGNSFGDHLHYTITTDPTWSSDGIGEVNPLTYFKNYTPMGPTMAGSNDEEKIWSFLRTSGASPIAAAAYMGNFQIESGNDPNTLEGYYYFSGEGGKTSPTVRNALKSKTNMDDYVLNKLFPNYDRNGVRYSRSGYMYNGHYYPGVGLAQWTGSRTQQLADLAESKNNSYWSDLGVQLSLWQQDISGTHKNEFDTVNTYSDLGTATDYVLTHYEGNPGNKVSERRNAAQVIYDKYKDWDFSKDSNVTGIGNSSTNFGTVNSAWDANLMNNVVQTGSETGRNAGIVMTTDSGLNLRSNPNTSCDVLEVIPKGTTINIESCSTPGWYKANYLGKNGYVSKDYIQTIGSWVNGSDAGVLDTVSNTLTDWGVTLTEPKQKSDYPSLYAQGDTPPVPPLDYSSFMDNNTSSNKNNIVVNKYEITGGVGLSEEKTKIVDKILNHTFDVRAKEIEKLLNKIIDKLNGSNNTQQTTQKISDTQSMFNDEIPESIAVLSRG